MFIVGIAGGTGSGKSTLVKKIKERLPAQSLIIIPQDNYYRDCSHLSPEARKEINFDHPNAIEFELLEQHLSTLKQGQAIEIPTYSFATSCRQAETILIYPNQKLILVEGILIFSNEALLDLFDLKIFIDTPDDIRLSRRIKRDIRERGQTLEDILKQYETSVKPMHDQFILPAKQKADLIIPAHSPNDMGIELVCSYLERFV